MSVYEIGLLGHVSDEIETTLSRTIFGLIADFRLVLGDDVKIRRGGEFENRESHAACAVAYLGGEGVRDVEETKRAVAASIPIIPTLEVEGKFDALIPHLLHGLNGLRLRPNDPELNELAVALLECVGLLRRQRRVFVSYRRVEARHAAVQLHDLLSGRGFDVFLDTHEIRPGEPFQEVLWHRLCDSDVLVMLDTPTYFANKWTRQELGRARAKEIHVLRVVWPDHSPNRHTEFSETIYLDRGELSNVDGSIVDAAAEGIALAVEKLRSRSIAARYMSITGKLRAEVIKIGGAVNGVGAHRAISLSLPDDTKLWAYPIVGIPTAELLNDVLNKAKRANQEDAPVLVYDHIGIGAPWMEHLRWLDENISSVRALSVVQSGWTLAAWENAQ